jgi:hypothetical protein
VQQSPQAYAAQPSQAAPQSSSTPAIPQSEADEANMDSEWVSKAQEVVSHYKTDPYVQSRELSKLKAQYLKARYNKDIKVSEDS